MPVKSVREPLDPAASAVPFGHNRHFLVLAASIRAREIAAERRKNDPDDLKVYDHTPAGQALVDFATGVCGAEYLDRLR